MIVQVSCQHHNIFLYRGVCARELDLTLHGGTQKRIGMFFYFL